MQIYQNKNKRARLSTKTDGTIYATTMLVSADQENEYNITLKTYFNRNRALSFINKFLYK